MDSFPKVPEDMESMAKIFQRHKAEMAKIVETQESMSVTLNKHFTALLEDILDHTKSVEFFSTISYVGLIFLAKNGTYRIKIYNHEIVASQILPNGQTWYHVCSIPVFNTLLAVVEDIWNKSINEVSFGTIQYIEYLTPEPKSSLGEGPFYDPLEK